METDSRQIAHLVDGEFGAVEMGVVGHEGVAGDAAAGGEAGAAVPGSDGCGLAVCKVGVQLESELIACW